MSPSTRREFCTQACQAASVAAFGALVAAACAGNPNSPSSGTALSTVSGTVAGRVISIAIDASSVLASVGSAALVQTTLGSYLIARTGQGAFSALTAVCTHQVCGITGISGSTFICPCHGSEFSATGAVVRGPATRSLQQFPTQFANDVLQITV